MNIDFIKMQTGLFVADQIAQMRLKNVLSSWGFSVHYSDNSKGANQTIRKV